MTSRMNKILTGLTALIAIAGSALVLAGTGTSTTPGAARSIPPTADSNYVPPNPPPNADVPIPRFVATHAVAVASEGFDWSAAAIGALASAGACVVLIGLALNIRGRNEPKPV